MNLHIFMITQQTTKKPGTSKRSGDSGGSHGKSSTSEAAEEVEVTIQLYYNLLQILLTIEIISHFIPFENSLLKCLWKRLRQR